MKNAKISDLIPDDKNFNKGTEFGNSLIEKSFREHGAGRSILIDKNNRIIAGNKSVENAASIGLDDVQIVESDGKRIIAVKRTDIDLDSPEGREMALADNASAKANIVFDAELIEAELGEAVCEEWGIETSKKLEATEDDYEIPDEIETDIVLGDLFEIGPHRLLCGDSTISSDVEKLMKGELVNMIWSDPPYNALKSWNKSKANSETRLNPSKWFNNDNLDWKDYKNFLSNYIAINKAPVIYTCCDFRIYEHIKEAMIKNGYKVKHCIVWKKNVFGLGKKFRFQHECIVYGELNNAKFYGSRSESDVWDAPVVKGGLHCTPKPIALPAKAITCSSVDNSIIYDPFLGSGTSMVASHQLNRKCYGIELDPKYCQVIIDRMLKLDPSIEIKKNGEHYAHAK